MLKACYEEAFPKKTKSKKREKKLRKPWVDPLLLKKIETKNKMYHAFVKTRDITELIAFKKYRNQINAELKHAKSIYYESLFSRLKGNLRKIWQHVNNLTGIISQTTSVKIITSQGTMCEADTVAELNQYVIQSGEYTLPGPRWTSPCPCQTQR